MKDGRKSRFPLWKQGITDKEKAELERIEYRRAAAREMLRRLSRNYNRIVQRAAARAKNREIQ